MSNNVIKEIQLGSWQEFVNILMPGGEYNFLLKDCVWRGQRSLRSEAWPLQAKYFRGRSNDVGFSSRNDLHAHYLRFMNNQHLSGAIHTFKEKQKHNSDYLAELCKFADEYETTPSSMEWTWGFQHNLKDWIWAQHYGISTPLLDWSSFPFYALFFAYQQHGKDTLGREIFALDTSLIGELYNSFYNPCSYLASIVEQDFFQDVLLNKIYECDEEFFCESELTNDKIISLVYHYNRDMSMIKIINEESKKDLDNARIIRQGGLFTYTPRGMSIEDYFKIVSRLGIADYVYRQYEPLNSACNYYFLYKFVIPDDKTEQEKCLLYLNAMNINHATIYPDFEGLAMAINLANNLPHNDISNVRLY